ncbi:hypothetical protein CANCADRAFT_963 [Tortispora caseinolytica NRRL Y-17796]|uniref:Uncharacterized protein n=1 Tax=Tortispora caseinolytica NRRL Y-17796 TaxID=767744 RepID=A0A1E4TKU2_9ASCO|nr:hypothetical protein CANCADRAFT_963 [Tortispora caseinolytica NRRL Y-17796]
MVKAVFISRHCSRIDAEDPTWKETAVTPYNPPLSARGFNEAKELGIRVKQAMHDCGGSKLSIHSSPFLRCIQTASEIAKTVDNVELSIDCSLGEWITSDYFTDITPPPEDNHRSLVETAHRYLNNSTTPGVNNRDAWKFGKGGEYDEEWSEMNERARKALGCIIEEARMRTIESDSANGNIFIGEVILIVSHGAICNSLIGGLSNRPTLINISVGSLSIALPVEEKPVVDSTSQSLIDRIGHWKLSQIGDMRRTSKSDSSDEEDVALWNSSRREMSTARSILSRSGSVITDSNHIRSRSGSKSRLHMLVNEGTKTQSGSLWKPQDLSKKLEATSDFNEPKIWNESQKQG